MSLFVIGDLHLSFSVDKPMDIFGEQWVNHQEKIKKNWIEVIKENDMILIPGDISWAMNMKDATIDLEWINNLPGKKILLRGNHDYWWASVSKMNKLFENIRFLQNNYFTYKNFAICGTRGWLCPNDHKFTEHDEKIYERELHRLKLSLDEAIKNGCKDIIVMTHYPPTNDFMEDSGFTQIYETYGVKKVVYGHLHGIDSFKIGLKGEYKGVYYYLTSCDYLDFKPLKILD
ncbi:serine/threonine protein phosphatase [Crassaminicella thermophila]|uniref:Serine/threonine protein phosphatase n=1 Tax=Crassaminicella thermophila TaxID=2599308 RepID=A0A5C0SH73_CRATE|nr:metallophosphoesterase [Crassaminicella thermophila]QEK12764.1 serine/threonine protein phosphatase [Crassaminicella thermophila]